MAEPAATADLGGLEEELRDKSRQLAVLNGIARAVNSSLDLEEVLAQALDNVVELMKLRPMGGIFLMGEDGQLHLEAHRGLTPEFARQESRVSMGECLCGLAAQTGELLHSADSRKDLRHTRESHAVSHAHIIVPLKSRNRVQGVMFLYPPLDYGVDPRDEQLWEMVGGQIGLAIENARLYGKTDERLQERVAELNSALQELQTRAEEIQARDKLLEVQNEGLQAANKALAAIEREKDELLAITSHILEAVTDAVLAVGTDGRVVRVNEAAARLIDCPREEAIGRLAREVFRWEDEAGRLLDEDEYAFRRATAEHRTVAGTSVYYRRADGSRVPVVISVAPIVDAEQAVEMVVQVVRDISREREVEDLKNSIISLVSHELRTPVAHIKGFASSLLETDIEWDAATQRDFITEIDREADRLSALVSDLLDMSRIESGADYLEKGRHRPAAIARQALAAVENVTAGHVVVNEVADDLPEIFADSSQIERVISNLTENAAKYSEAGTEIRVSAQLARDNVQFCVADQGPGIPPEYRDRIFERFFRVKTGHPGIPGTGLGLPICKGIVEAHSGRLWVESVENEGSRFFFTLPLGA